ncbi:hypothetical protein FRC11_009136 [Ceratobasidium sp. 423]|nr:hypothetical protein FRC11_009136 [Ceratobasidium sp. 423]
MYFPNIYRFLLPVLSVFSSQRDDESTGEPTQRTPARVPATFDICPKFTVRCVKGGNWPEGIVGNIGKKDFCWGGFRCNQCDIEANKNECNVKFPECEDTCDAFAPIPF